MSMITRILIAALALCDCTLLLGQRTEPAKPAVSVALVVRISGSLATIQGSAPQPIENLTFGIYATEAGETRLWQETQKVSVDGSGHYSVLLGATREEGLPGELFAAGEPRWLGVRIERSGEIEPSRTLLDGLMGQTRGAAAQGRRSAIPPDTPASTAEVGSSRAKAGVAGALRSEAASPSISSTGTTNSIAMFTDNSGDIGNSALYQNGARIGLGTTGPLDYLHVAFNDVSGGFTGYAVQNLGSGAASYSGMLFYDQNGALGQFQGFNNSTHEYRINNIASNGSINFMLGSASKFQVRPDGDINIAGSIRKGGSLLLHNAGTQNASFGLGALAASTGAGNTAVGYQALASNTTGGNNTAFGLSALAGNTSGSGNIALGANAGSNLTTGSNNITIANPGVAGEAATIRIGVSGPQTRSFLAGIRGVTTANADAIAVMIDSSGQLGTMSSSARFKTDIHNMGDASRNLLKLRPVTFRYREHPSDRLEYGLIAEEVAEVYPDLVVKGADGLVETVQYQKLTPMLLNELQREHSETLQELRVRDEKIRRQEEINRSLQDRIAALERMLSVSAPSANTKGR